MTDAEGGGTKIRGSGVAVAYALWLSAIELVQPNGLVTLALVALASATIAFALPRTWWFAALVSSVSLDAASLAAQDADMITRLIAMPVAAFAFGWLWSLLRGAVLP